jgi:hypothetical protein
VPIYNLVNSLHGMFCFLLQVRNIVHNITCGDAWSGIIRYGRSKILPDATKEVDMTLEYSAIFLYFRLLSFFSKDHCLHQTYFVTDAVLMAICF